MKSGSYRNASVINRSKKHRFLTHAFKNYFCLLHKPWIIKLEMTRWKADPLYFFPSTPVVAKVLKLSTVLGTSFPNRPMTILPAFWSPMVTSKKTWSVMVKNVAYKENKEISQRCIEIVGFIKKEICQTFTWVKATRQQRRKACINAMIKK